MGKKIRVIVVDDSGLMRLIISDIIRSTEDMELIGTAEDGKSAVELVSKALPGVVLMDINMSPHDGLYGVEEILKRHKVPIILLSSVGNSDLDRVFQALKLGAVDYINKPKKNKNKLREIGDEIIERVRSIAHSSNLQLSEQRSNTNQHAHTFDENLAYQVVVIGASTGGPTAIEKVIRNLPSNLPVPVLIAQHMHANFITTFSSRLNRCTPLMVKIGRAGETLRPGVIYVMPGNTNSIVERRADNNVYLVESNQQYKEYNHPSINALMHSVGETYGRLSLAALLTGMGKDGADGLETIVRNGGYAIAQDEQTSVIFGMPKEAIARDIVHQVVPIDELGGFIVNCIS